MSESVALQSAYELVGILEEATDAELAEGAELLEGVGDRLPLVGVDALVSQLREARSVTGSLMEMGAVLSPATFCILSSAHARAEKTLEAAETLRPQA